MATFACQFGAYTFRASEWSESVAQRIEAVTVPRRDGILVSDGRPDGKRVDISGILTAATAEALRTEEDAMLTAFRNTGGTTPVNQLRMWSDRYLNAQLDSWQRDYERSVLTRLRWRASFLAASPYLISDTLTTQVENPDSTAFTFSATGGGTAPVYPSITITAGAAVDVGMRLINTTGNAYIQYNALMSSGDVLVLDHDALTAVDNGVNVLASVVGDFWALAPGANSIRYEGSTSSVTLGLAWRDRWY